jgi:hypothetical protein
MAIVDLASVRPSVVEGNGRSLAISRRASSDDVPDYEAAVGQKIRIEQERQQQRQQQQPGSPLAVGIKKRIIGMYAIVIFAIINLYSHWETPDIMGLISSQSMGMESSQSTTMHRGGGILTVQSGCRMSKWVFQDDMWGCNSHTLLPRPDIRQLLHNASQLEEYDTVYVPLTQVDRFVNEILTNLTANVVVISGDEHDVWPPSNTAIYLLSTHPRVLKWFCQNLPKYGGANPFHPKIAPFPFGLYENVKDRKQSFIKYKEVLFGSIQNDSLLNKTNFIFVGPLGKHGNGRRSSMPQSGPMEPADYFLEMAKSKYVLSPDGDRPECYRHYEAIGLKTVPITQLDPFFFRHLGSGPTGPVIFGNTEWNLTLLEKNLFPWPAVKPSMIREDYWMNWVDDVVGFRLNWNTYENGNGLTLLENSLLALLD